MNSVAKADLDFCWGEVLKGDAWFKLHFTFAPKAVAEQILALHALFAMLERPTVMSDESLATAQLAWWQAELSPRSATVSAHPVVRTLRNSKALESLPISLRQALVAQALELLRRSRPRSRSDLKARCSGIGEARVMSELSLVSKGRTLEELQGHCAGTGLSRMLSLALRSGAGLWFVPLDLQARFQGSAQVKENPTAESTALMNAVGDLGEDWFREQLEEIRRKASTLGLSPWKFQHLFATMASQRLQLKRTIQSLKQGSGTGPARWRTADVMRIWRDCRSLSRSTGGN